MPEDKACTFADIAYKETGVRSREELFKRALFGLTISGGGIRSATFALGVIQYLAQIKLLSKLHYLSTVSGGGYIGSWLSAWINRSSMKYVESALVPPPKDETKQIEDPTITWLRKYGKYLAPDASLFSADTWLIGSIWSRNTFLNLLLLTFYLSAVLLVPWVLLGLYQYTEGTPTRWEGAVVARVWITVAVALAMLGMTKKPFVPLKDSRTWFGIGSAFFVVFASLWHVFSLRDHASLDWWPFVLGAILGFVVGLSMLRSSPNGPGKWVRVFLCTVATFLGIPGLEYVIVLVSTSITGNQRVLIPILEPQLVTILYSTLFTLLIGIVGWRQGDERREWWSRVGAWTMIFGLVGLVLASISIMGPPLLFLISAKTSLLLATSSVWTLATGAGVLLGRSASTAGEGKGKHRNIEAVLPFAAIIFLTGFLVLAATGVYVVLARFSLPGSLTIPANLPTVICPKDCEISYLSRGMDALWSNAWAQYAGVVQRFDNPLDIFIWLVIAVLLFLFFSRLFDINEFSMFPFYRNRLVRAYQGASRVRDADDFTNLDLNDDVKIRDLRDWPYGCHTGPIHLINTAVNLNLAEAGLDERRAASFVFTPWACGYSHPFGGEECYREFTDDHWDFRIGTPITISGAAASPNMGYHTSAPLAFLMTLFNVRMGFWMYNTSNGVCTVANWVQNHFPRFKPDAIRKMTCWKPQGPRFGTFYYLFELLAMASGKRKYVYLSDGGHFENLGVYELLRRRCKYVICIDAEQDSGMKFEGLGALVRKARSDMGIEITIDVSKIEERNAGGFSNRHCAVAEIQYPEKGAKGTLLYLKSSVTGDESMDILHYRKGNEDFPHQSTGNQFFRESQFESYRALGYHVAESAFHSVTTDGKSVQQIFEDLHFNEHKIRRQEGEVNDPTLMA